MYFTALPHLFVILTHHHPALIHTYFIFLTRQTIICLVVQVPEGDWFSLLLFSSHGALPGRAFFVYLFDMMLRRARVYFVLFYWEYRFMSTYHTWYFTYISCWVVDLRIYIDNTTIAIATSTSTSHRKGNQDILGFGSPRLP